MHEIRASIIIDWYWIPVVLFTLIAKYIFTIIALHWECGVQSENNVWLSLCLQVWLSSLFPCLSAGLPLFLPPLSLPLPLSHSLSVSCLLLFISPSHLSWVLRTRHSHSHSAVAIAENYSYSLNMASSGQCSSPSCCCCCSLSVLIIFRWYSLQGIIITIITTIRRIPRFFSFYFSFSFRSPADCRYHTHTHVWVCASVCVGQGINVLPHSVDSRLISQSKSCG